jgi:hypothetical protein
MELLRNNHPQKAHAFIVKTLKGILPLRNLDPKVNYKYIWR